MPVPQRSQGRPTLLCPWMISGAAPACPPPRSSNSPRPTRSDGRWGSPGAKALWAIKALRDEPLPHFAAATAREEEPVPEVDEPAVALRPMTVGSEVVEDYGHVGLTLRQHPIAFLRADLAARRIVNCTEEMQARDGRWLEFVVRPVVPGPTQND